METLKLNQVELNLLENDYLKGYTRINTELCQDLSDRFDVFRRDSDDKYFRVEYIFISDDERTHYVKTEKGSPFYQELDGWINTYKDAYAQEIEHFVLTSKEISDISVGKSDLFDCIDFHYIEGQYDGVIEGEIIIAERIKDKKIFRIITEVDKHGKYIQDEETYENLYIPYVDSVAFEVQLIPIVKNHYI